MNNKFIKLGGMTPPYGESWHTIPAIDVMFKGVIFSSSGKHKIEIFVEDKIIVAFFCDKMQVSQVDWLIPLTTATRLSAKITSMENLSCDHYITFMLEDNWDAYSAQFTQELDKTLTD